MPRIATITKATPSIGTPTRSIAYLRRCRVAATSVDMSTILLIVAMTRLPCSKGPETEGPDQANQNQLVEHSDDRKWSVEADRYRTIHLQLNSVRVVSCNRTLPDSIGRYRPSPDPYGVAQRLYRASARILVTGGPAIGVVLSTMRPQWGSHQLGPARSPSPGRKPGIHANCRDAQPLRAGYDSSRTSSCLVPIWPHAAHTQSSSRTNV
jgi:hypothetical protein